MQEIKLWRQLKPDLILFDLVHENYAIKIADDDNPFMDVVYICTCLLARILAKNITLSTICLYSMNCNTIYYLI